MTLRQLEYLRAIARESLNISNAAATLHKSQPGLSRQVRSLEAELGGQLLIRRKNRVLGLTPLGESVVEAAGRALEEIDNIRMMARDSRPERSGKLTIAASHLHARYTLLKPVRQITSRHPDLQLYARHADPDEVPLLVETGEADVGLATAIPHEHPSLAILPNGVIRRSLITPIGHPLGAKRSVTLADIAAHPLIAYDERSRRGGLIANAFKLQGLHPRVVASATDSGVIMSYVESGMGVAVVATIALDDSSRVQGLDVTRLFPPTFMTICLRRNIYLRRYLVEFIQMVAPRIRASDIKRAMGAIDV